MPQTSNNIVGFVNLLSFLISIPMVIAGVSMSQGSAEECYQVMAKPMIIIGGFFMFFSLVGIIGACCNVTFLLIVYLVLMMFAIIVGIIFSMIMMIATSKEAEEVKTREGYKEYRLPDDPSWLAMAILKENSWESIKSCLTVPEHNVCTDLKERQINSTATELDQNELTPIQSGCCKPPSECGFVYGGMTTWTKNNGGSSKNNDCNLWNNDDKTLCFECQSCKAGFIYGVKDARRKSSVVNIVFCIFIIIFYFISICALGNSAKHG
ncbi:tetraspanin-8-like [Gossypium arboreum]|uniref:tetraspanin-8-like n=1 Tax=Gossypium arboreum TaxID=29729 RepID=UPI0008196B01|nr:tetraspanin-8-like [Gossypium arboreum]